MLLSHLVDNNGHYTSELLDVLHFLDKVAVTTIDHYYMLVAIGSCFLEMCSIKLALVELLAAVLIQERVVNTTLKYALLIVATEMAEGRAKKSLIGTRIELEHPGKLVRMQYMQFVTLCNL